MRVATRASLQADPFLKSYFKRQYNSAKSDEHAKRFARGAGTTLLFGIGIGLNGYATLHIVHKSHELKRVGGRKQGGG